MLQLSKLSFASFVTTALAASQSLPLLPLDYAYGGYPRVSTNISYGTPSQTAINTVVDLGSSNFWTFGPNATVNYGDNHNFAQGPCNVTAKPAFNWPKSSTAKKNRDKSRGYSYGGNGKLIDSDYAVNDTVAFSNKAYPALKNQQVAISSYGQIAQAVNNCSQPFDYDHAILGLSKYTSSDPFALEGPSFRENLFNSGSIASRSFAMWFDKTPNSIKDSFRGTAMFGAIPKSKYAGSLVCVKPKPPAQSIGYYVGRPVFESAPVKTPKAKKSVLKLAGKPDSCLVDSGSGTDTLPIDQDAFLKTTGLVLDGGYPAFNGPCESIPRNATIDYIFAGASGKNVTVSIPLRNYARGINDYLNHPNKCGLSMELDSSSSCTFGAPFFTGAFIAINDDKNQIAIAQGGVSSGAVSGVNGIGAVTTIAKGQGLPCV